MPGGGPGTEDVLVAADRALYRAKAAGRNQVATGDR
jgi:PleD family two-component response regulator